MPRKSGLSKCTLWYCDAPYYSQGLCAKHYQNLRRFGTSVANSDRDTRELLGFIGASVPAMRMVVDKLIHGGICSICGGMYTEHTEECPVGVFVELLEQYDEKGGNNVIVAPYNGKQGE